MVKTYIKLVLTTFFWGGTFVAAKVAVGEGPPFTVAAWRFAVAALILFALVIFLEARKQESSFPVPQGWSEWLGLLALGLTGIFCYNIAFFFGLQQTTAANGSLIVAINPIVTALLSALFLRETIRLQQVAGFACAFTGVLIVISKGSWQMLSSLQFNQGDLILLAAPLSWATYSILGKKVMANAKFTPMVSTAYACLFGAVMLGFMAVLFEWSMGVKAQFSWQGWLAILQLAVLGTVLGFVWWYQGVTQIGVSKSSIFINMVPMFGILLAALILGEALSWPQAIGFFFVISGVYIGTVLDLSALKMKRTLEGKGAA